MKRADILSPAYLAWIRTQPCYFGDARCLGHSHAHHYPPKGRLGYTDDLSTLPVCMLEHDRCHGITVVQDGARLKPITREEQHFAVLVTHFRFWHDAPAEVRQAVCTEISDHGSPKGGSRIPW
jgi:hypothetical protein